jgi:hypothetical protein
MAHLHPLHPETRVVDRLLRKGVEYRFVLRRN